MSRIITVRLTDEDYRKIAMMSKFEHRAISNFMTYTTLKRIEESGYVDVIEMAQIRGDKRLMSRLKRGHRQSKQMKGKFVA